DYLGWKLEPEEFAAATTIVLLISFSLAFLAGLIFISTPLKELLVALTKDPVMAIAYAFFPFILGALGAVYYFQMYPSIAAKKEQTKALTYVPEIMGYMVMSIKLVPNLEKAIEFAAVHGKGKIANDFKNLIWETQIGIHNSLSEGLDALAYRWGKYSEEFKRALMRIRASVIENTEAKRYALLDQTMSEMLESIRIKMEQYARELSQPSTMLFYIGVLLPLLLIIILPVGSSFSGAPLANPLVLFLIYNIVIPLITVVFAYNLLESRPPTYNPPKIPDDYPGLLPKWKIKVSGANVDARFLAILVLIFGLITTSVLSTQGFPPKFLYGSDDPNLKYQIISPDRTKEQVLTSAGFQANHYDTDYPANVGKVFNLILATKLPNVDPDNPESFDDAVEKAKKETISQEKLFFSKGENDIAPYKMVFGFLISFSLCLYILFYLSNKQKRKIQLDVQEMETEFKDSLYVIASRMAENKPIEDAMKHVQEFLPDLKISKLVFAKTLDNIKLLGMPLEQAVFDKKYGSIANIPSTIIFSSMRMLVDSVQLGVNVAARTMISLSIQLQNAEKVNNTLKILVSDITGTMKTMTLFIAPIVLGITTSLQRIVIVTISSLAASGTQNSLSNIDAGGAAGSFSSMSASGFISPEAIAGIATPTEFILIVAFYIIELVAIMVYFTTKIEEDNNLLVQMNIARYLPVAVIIFVLSMIVSNIFVSVV
ncbi:MAG: hypothetical protein NUV57_04465, partial [archaeon]|nr:hypothetical protein [archaeon]